MTDTTVDTDVLALIQRARIEDWSHDQWANVVVGLMHQHNDLAARYNELKRAYYDQRRNKNKLLDKLKKKE